MPLVAFVSFRFGPHDGVSVEARKWAWAFRHLGWDVRWVAGSHDSSDVRTGDRSDRVTVGGLAIDPIDAPDRAALAGHLDAALAGCDVVVVENLLSLPLNPDALTTTAQVLRGRPTIVHHHDLPWQRQRFVDAAPPPDDAAWAHVTINRRSASELATRAGIEAVTVYNRFAAPAAPPREIGHRPVSSPLLLHPTRAIARKNVPAAVHLAEAVGGTYWLFGPAEDGYDDELAAILDVARCPIRHGALGRTIDEAYDECDLVVLPSHWEGFGNATIESALTRRPLAIGRYPVADELREFGFEWFDAEDHDAIRRWLEGPDPRLLDRNDAIARAHFLVDGLPACLTGVLERVV